jgi:hypothetical protein
MSIWSDIQDRSAGITIRKEDEINITLQDLTPKITFDVIKDIRTLPVASQNNVGKIYLIDTDCGIFNKGDIICNAGLSNGGWTVIGSDVEYYETIMNHLANVDNQPKNII